MVSILKLSHECNSKRINRLQWFSPGQWVNTVLDTLTRPKVWGGVKACLLPDCCCCVWMQVTKMSLESYDVMLITKMCNTRIYIHVFTFAGYVCSSSWSCTTPPPRCVGKLCWGQPTVHRYKSKLCCLLQSPPTPPFPFPSLLFPLLPLPLLPSPSPSTPCLLLFMHCNHSD